MNLNHETSKTKDCPQLNAGCIIATGRCIGPVLVRQYTKESQLLTTGVTCSKSAVRRLNLPLVSREGNIGPVVRENIEKVPILKDILAQYLDVVTLDPSAFFVESTARGPSNINTEAVFIIIDNDQQTPISKG